MAIEIVDLPSYKMEIFHSYVNVYRWVSHTVSYVSQKTLGHTVSYEYYESLDCFKGTFPEHLRGSPLASCIYHWALPTSGYGDENVRKCHRDSPTISAVSGRGTRKIARQRIEKCQG